MDKKTEQAEQEPAAVYGFCPICGREGVSRERGFNGNDTCVTGHRYASSEAILDFPQPVQEPVKQEPVAEVVSEHTHGVYESIKKLVDYRLPCKTKLYAAPTYIKDLTDVEVEKVWRKHGGYMVMPIDFARAVIAAYKEKNA